MFVWSQIHETQGSEDLFSHITLIRQYFLIPLNQYTKGEEQCPLGRLEPNREKGLEGRNRFLKCESKLEENIRDGF